MTYDRMSPDVLNCWRVGWAGLADEAMHVATKTGWHGQEHHDAVRIALMHSELSEALEAMRCGNPPDKHLPGHSAVAVELADLVIRVMEFDRHAQLGVGAAVLAKLRYNRTRPHKHGGKEF